jgi:hypothetical protein
MPCSQPVREIEPKALKADSKEKYLYKLAFVKCRRIYGEMSI